MYKKFIESLVNELKRLEDKYNLTMIAENGKSVDEILERDADYSALNEYMEDHKNYRTLKMADIPKEYVTTLTIYLSESDWNPDELLEDYNELLTELYDRGDIWRKISQIPGLINDFRGFDKMLEEAILNCGD